MKPYITILFAIMLVSCGNENLNKTSSLELIKDCPTGQNLRRVIHLDLGEKGLNSRKKAQYEGLKEKGVITMDEKGNKFNIQLTDEGKNYLVDYKGELTPTEKIYGRPKSRVFLKAASYEVLEVLEIQEFPELNVAKVKAKFRLKGNNPFSVFLKKQPGETLNKDLEFRKTTDGWKFCKNH